MAVNRELVSASRDDGRLRARCAGAWTRPRARVHGQPGRHVPTTGNFESVCYHPLLLFNQHGDCLAAKLRPGNVHSADDWDELHAAGDRAPTG